MSNDDLVKLSIALASAFGGWLLAQISSGLKNVMYRRRVRKLLLEELSDICKEADRLLAYYARKLQLFGAEGLDSSGQVTLANPIFDNYYKDAVLSLNQDQRISFQMIDGLIAQANRLSSEFDLLTEDLRKEARASDHPNSIFANGYARWGELAKGGYIAAAILKWHAQYHRNNKQKPSLEMGDETHKAYLNYLEEVVSEADTTIEQGKSIPREKFGQVYDPDSFGARL